MKSTAPNLPRISARTSSLNARRLLPPIGRPESLSGLTSYRPHPRRLVAPPRKYFFENGTLPGRLTDGLILPNCSRLATTTLEPIGR